MTSAREVEKLVDLGEAQKPFRLSLFSKPEPIERVEMANEKSVMGVIRAARPTFRNNPDKIAFVVHASFLASGYVLISTGAPAFADNALYSSSTDEVAIDHWNDYDNEYAFLYINPDKGGKKVLAKCLVVGDKFLLDVLADDNSEQVHLEIPIRDFIGEDGGSNVSAQFKNLDKLVKDLNDHILAKLHPTKTKSSYGIESSVSSRQERGEPSVWGTEPSSPIHPSGVVIPPVPPFIGGDVNPGFGAGMYPPRGGIGDGGSMLLGPNDPRWFRGDPPNFHAGQPGVPPGARFDPYGPPGVPGFEPNRFARNPRRPGGLPHPDLQHFNDGDFI